MRREWCNGPNAADYLLKRMSDHVKKVTYADIKDVDGDSRIWEDEDLGEDENRLAWFLNEKERLWMSEYITWKPNVREDGF